MTVLIASPALLVGSVQTEPKRQKKGQIVIQYSKIMGFAHLLQAALEGQKTRHEMRRAFARLDVFRPGRGRASRK
jgi:hypothetical protein